MGLYETSGNVHVTHDIISAYLLRGLYINSVFPQLITRAFDEDFTGGKGDTAKIRRPATFTPVNFDESDGVSYQAASIGSISIVVDTLPDITIRWGDAERRLKMDKMQELILDPIVNAHVEQIERNLAGLYKAVPTYYGTPGTTPNAKSDILQARKNLVDQKVPDTGRKFVMDSACEAEFLDLFSDADKDGSTAALRQASLGQRFGMDCYVSQAIATQTPGTGAGNGLEADAGAGTFQLNATYAAAVTSVVLKASGGILIGKLAQGDILDITLDDGTVQSVSVEPAGGATSVTAAANLITCRFADGQSLNSAATAGNNVNVVGLPTRKGTTGTVAAGDVIPYTNNLMFDAGAFGIAFAPTRALDGAVESGVKNYKGFGLRTTTFLDGAHKISAFSTDLLYGIKCIDPRRATRLIG